MKVRNLKANHNRQLLHIMVGAAVLASVKVRNLKANHNTGTEDILTFAAVLASVKVRNLNNQSRDLFTTAHLVVMAIGCCSA